MITPVFRGVTGSPETLSKLPHSHTAIWEVAEPEVQLRATCRQGPGSFSGPKLPPTRKVFGRDLLREGEAGREPEEAKGRKPETRRAAGKEGAGRAGRGSEERSLCWG